MAAVDAIDIREIAGQPHMALRFRRDRLHRGVRAQTGIKHHFQRAIRIQPCNPAASRALNVDEVAANDDAARGIQRHRTHRAVRPGADAEAVVHGAIDIDPHQVRVTGARHAAEAAAHHRAVIGQERHRVHLAARQQGRVVSQIQRAVRIQPCQPCPRHAVHIVEHTTDDDLLIRLDLDGIDEAVRTRGPAGERRIRIAARVQPRDATARERVHLREAAADQNLAAAEDLDREDRTVRSEAGPERGIAHAVRVQAGEVGLRETRRRLEGATDDDTAVRLKRQRIDDVVEAHARIEGRVERAIHVHARNAIDRDAFVTGEVAADDDLAIRLNDQRIHRIIGPDAQRRAERRVEAADAVVIDDAQHGARRCEQERPARRGTEGDVHRLVVLRDKIINQRYGDAHVGDARGEGQVGHHARVIHARRGRAVAGREGHAHRDIRGPRAEDADERVGGILAHAVGRRAELEGNVIVHDGQEGRAVDAERRTAGGVRQEEEDGFIALGQEVAGDRDVHQLLGDAGREVHDHADRRVIQACRGRAVRGGEADGHRGVGHAQPTDRDVDRTAGLRDRVAVGREVDRRVVVGDGQHRRGATAEHRVAGRQTQRQVHRLRPLDEGVVKDRHTEGLDRLRGIEGQRAQRRGVVQSRAGRAVAGGVVDADHRVRVATADDRDDRVQAVLRDRVVRAREVEADVVVEDRQHRVGLRAEEARAREIAQVKQDRLRRFHQRVVNDADVERRLRHARIEGQRAVGQDVIQTGRRRAVAHRKLHRDEVVRRPRPQHRDERVGLVLQHRVGRLAELHHAIVVHDGDDRIGQAGQRAAGEVEQTEVHRLVSFREEVVSDRDREGAAEHPGAEGERVRHRRVVAARRGRRAIGRGVADRHGAREAVGARDGDRHRADVFIDHVIVRAEAEVAGAEVIIEDRQHRVDLRPEVGAARRVGEVEVHGFIPLDQEVLEDRDVHRHARHARQEHQVRR